MCTHIYSLSSLERSLSERLDFFLRDRVGLRDLDLCLRDRDLDRCRCLKVSKLIHINVLHKKRIIVSDIKFWKKKEYRLLPIFMSILRSGSITLSILISRHRVSIAIPHHGILFSITISILVPISAHGI